MSEQTHRSFFYIAVLLAATSGSIIHAQPRGGYLQSCRDTTVQGDLLRSSCKDRGGAFHPAELRGFAQCVGDIFNDNGALRCSKGTPPPPGGYTQSCEQTFIDGQNLRSNCRNRGGGLVATTLPNFRQCVGDIFNDNGALRCSMGGAAPAGGYTQSCSQTFVAGQDLKSNCRNIAGAVVATTLPNFRQCVGNIFNADGVLRCNRGGQPPAGTYTSTCDFSWMEGTTLHSTCKTHPGFTVQATLTDVTACRSTISNMDGILSCAKGSGPIPPGTYVNSCANIQVTPTSITAFCTTQDRRGRTSSIADPGACRTPIENIDGFLACAKGNAAPPIGTYHDSCHDVVVTGTVLSASCRRGDGGYQQSSVNFANCASSVSNNQGSLACVIAAAPPPPAQPATQLICASATIPTGWIVNDIVSDRTRCGGTPSNNPTDNVYSIVQYATVAVNGSLVVCDFAKTPSNWVETGKFSDTLQCAHHGTPTPDNNVKAIKRLQ
ncbi:MAG: hypothetical protein JWP63_2313 [Candidatus Solibacter sp.]|nr:hypothetical protein [Candidatus Solibacter sp.]